MGTFVSALLAVDSPHIASSSLYCDTPAPSHSPTINNDTTGHVTTEHVAAAQAAPSRATALAARIEAHRGLVFATRLPTTTVAGVTTNSDPLVSGSVGASPAVTPPLLTVAEGGECPVRGAAAALLAKLAAEAAAVAEVAADVDADPAAFEGRWVTVGSEQVTMSTEQVSVGSEKAATANATVAVAPALCVRHYPVTPLYNNSRGSHKNSNSNTNNATCISPRTAPGAGATARAADAPIDVAIIMTKGTDRLSTAVTAAARALGYGNHGHGHSHVGHGHGHGHGDSGSAASDREQRRSTSDREHQTAVSSGGDCGWGAAVRTMRRRGVLLCLMNGAGHRDTMERDLKMIMHSSSSSSPSHSDKTHHHHHNNNNNSNNKSNNNNHSKSSSSSSDEEGPIVLLGTTAMGAIVLPTVTPAAAPAGAHGLPVAPTVPHPLVLTITGWGDTVICEPPSFSQVTVSNGEVTVSPAEVLTAIMSNCFAQSSVTAKLTYSSPANARINSKTFVSVRNEMQAATSDPQSPCSLLSQLPRSNFSENVVVWRKLLANCVINPLTALTRGKNGTLVAPLTAALETTEHDFLNARSASDSCNSSNSNIKNESSSAVSEHSHCNFAAVAPLWLLPHCRAGAVKTAAATEALTRDSGLDPVFVRALVTEAVTVAKTQGVTLFPQPQQQPQPEAQEQCISTNANNPSSASTRDVTVNASAAVSVGEVNAALDSVRLICARTVNNTSSMLSDVLARADTEIGYINEQIVRWGRELGVPTPANEIVVAAVRAVEKDFKAGKHAHKRH